MRVEIRSREIPWEGEVLAWALGRGVPPRREQYVVLNHGSWSVTLDTSQARTLAQGLKAAADLADTYCYDAPLEDS